MAENKGPVIDPETLSGRESMALQWLRASQP